jgi:hypothetical protein
VCHSRASYTSPLLAYLPCYECIVHSKTSFMTIQPYSPSYPSFELCACSSIDRWIGPIKGAPT